MQMMGNQTEKIASPEFNTTGETAYYTKEVMGLLQISQRWSSSGVECCLQDSLLAQLWHHLCASLH